MSLRWLPQDQRSFPNTLQLSRVERLVCEADPVLQKEDGPPVRQKGRDFFRQIFEGSDIEHGERRRRSRHLDGFLSLDIRESPSRSYSATATGSVVDRNCVKGQFQMPIPSPFFLVRQKTV